MVVVSFAVTVLIDLIGVVDLVSETSEAEAAYVVSDAIADCAQVTVPSNDEPAIDIAHNGTIVSRPLEIDASGR